MKYIEIIKAASMFIMAISALIASIAFYRSTIDDPQKEFQNKLYESMIENMRKH